jgi:hypothetical protein
MHKCRDARMARSGRDATLRVHSRTRSNRRGRKLAALKQTASCFLFALRRSVARKSQLVVVFTVFMIANLAQQGMSVSGIWIATVTALLRNDNEGMNTNLEKPPLVPFSRQ